MVERRWAITKLVRPFMRVSMAFWTFCSVRVSTELVASSRMSSGASFTIARAMVMSWRWPTERLDSSVMTVS